MVTRGRRGDDNFKLNTGIYYFSAISARVWAQISFHNISFYTLLTLLSSHQVIKTWRIDNSIFDILNNQRSFATWHGDIGARGTAVVQCFVTDSLVFSPHPGPDTWWWRHYRPGFSQIFCARKNIWWLSDCRPWHGARAVGPGRARDCWEPNKCQVVTNDHKYEPGTGPGPAPVPATPQ